VQDAAFMCPCFLARTRRYCRGIRYSVLSGQFRSLNLPRRIVVSIDEVIRKSSTPGRHGTRSSLKRRARIRGSDARGPCSGRERREKVRPGVRRPVQGHGEPFQGCPVRMYGKKGCQNKSTAGRRLKSANTVAGRTRLKSSGCFLVIKP